MAFLDEVDGFDLMSLPVAPAVPWNGLGEYVPMVYSSSARFDPLLTTAVAIPLASVFARDTGLCKFADRAALLRAFRVAEGTQLVLSGVDDDRRIEPYWTRGRDAGLISALARLQPSLVTVPNFSLLSDVPRHDNLINMKRIAISWLELTHAGLAAALHVNARTYRDWQRWTEFIIHQPAVRVIAFEFGTGARFNNRGKWYADQLIRLANAVNRPLHLVLRGTTRHHELRSAFTGVTLIDTCAYTKATRRFKAMPVPNGKVRWHRSMTLEGQLVDHLLQHNVNTCSNYYTTDRVQLPAA